MNMAAIMPIIKNIRIVEKRLILKLNMQNMNAEAIPTVKKWKKKKHNFASNYQLYV